MSMNLGTNFKPNSLSQRWELIFSVLGFVLVGAGIQMLPVLAL